MRGRRDPGAGTERWASKAADIAAIYTRYPRREARSKAEAAIERAVKSIARHQSLSLRDAAAWLLNRVSEYATSGLIASKTREYIPLPATFMNQARYDDPPEAWEAPALQTAGAGPAVDPVKGVWA